MDKILVSMTQEEYLDYISGKDRINDFMDDLQRKLVLLETMPRYDITKRVYEITEKELKEIIDKYFK